MDVSRYSTRKLPAYAKIGIREVWLWRNEIRVFALSGDKYERQPESGVLPEFPVAAVSHLIRNRAGKDVNALLHEFIKIQGTN